MHQNKEIQKKILLYRRVIFRFRYCSIPKAHRALTYFESWMERSLYAIELQLN